jgi:5'-3' exoribonuclease 1
MGIKHFFMWFKKQFGDDMHRLGKGQDLAAIGVEIDNLMIDMNGVFHNSAQRIYEYGNFKPNPRLLRNNKSYKKPNGLQLQLRLFQDICKTIEELFKITKPKKKLILCVDGPAPLSKQNQQRQRRFRSAMEAEENSSFNSNSITPGTKFMDYLTKYIDWYIRKRINEDSEWQDVQVIFSNEKAPGEGEHKIINYIRYYGDINETYCINGLDADLIMLALGTHMPNFYILREDMYDPRNEFFCVDIGAIRGKLAEELRWKEQKYVFDTTTAINDFIFLCFMVGNDFLPHIPSIEIIENGIELILEVYRETGTECGHITCTEAGRVMFLPQPLGIFLGIIGEYEKENFEKKLAKKESFFPDPLLESCAVQQESVWHIDIDKYKQNYHKSCFAEGITNENLCHEYLEGMQWVLSYYTRGVPNWKWNFRHHYAPPASVISKHCNSFRFPSYGRTIPSTPFQQLLCVLPPKSADLIPEPLCNLLTHEESPLKQYCPDDFDIDLSGKRREWEGIVILPMVDFELVRTHYMKNLHKIDKREMKRNVTGRSFLYEYVPNLPCTFHSYYGDIECCRVRSLMIDL